jgi:hypothetical protein
MSNPGIIKSKSRETLKAAYGFPMPQKVVFTFIFMVKYRFPTLVKGKI